MRSLLGKTFKTIFFTVFIALLCLLCSCSGLDNAETTEPDLFAPQLTADVCAPTASSTFIVRSFENLKAASESNHCKEVVIEADITLTEDVIFEHSVSVTVKGKIEAGTYSIMIKSFENDTVSINVTNGSTVSSGALIVNAPYTDLLWAGSCVPSVDFVLENMVVGSFNGTNLREHLVGGSGDAVFESMKLIAAGGKVIDDVEVSVNRNVITLAYPFSLNESLLRSAKIEIFASESEETEITDCNGKIIESLALGKRYIVNLKDCKGESRGYYLDVVRKCNNLPVVSVHTDGEAPINSKDVYTKGFFSIDCSGSEEYRNFSLNEKSLGIKGRGNASWNYTDKKSYRLKFDEKVSILGMPPDKDWVLVSNYFDKSLIRNVVAHELAKNMEHLEYTPTHIPVDLFINGEYRGVYTIADKIEVSDEKVNINTSESVKEPGFLIEIGWDYSSENIYGKHYFDVEKIKRLYVKDPEIVSKYNSRMCGIIDYVRNADAAISTGKGYEKYIDVDSMVDWFIIAELTNNTEMAFYRSCYFYREAGGKIKMGPVWDFDMAFGNSHIDIPDYNGWATAESVSSYVNDTWTTYLIKDEAFMEKVKVRWNEKKDCLLKTATDTIEKSSLIINDSQIENFKKWDIMNKQVGNGKVDYTVYNTYEKQVLYVSEFITNRAEWIDNKLNTK